MEFSIKFHHQSSLGALEIPLTSRKPWCLTKHYLRYVGLPKVFAALCPSLKKNLIEKNHYEERNLFKLVANMHHMNVNSLHVFPVLGCAIQAKRNELSQKYQKIDNRYVFGN